MSVWAMMSESCDSLLFTGDRDGQGEPLTVSAMRPTPVF